MAALASSELRKLKLLCLLQIIFFYKAKHIQMLNTLQLHGVRTSNIYLEIVFVKIRVHGPCPHIRNGQFHSLNK